MDPPSSSPEGQFQRGPSRERGESRCPDLASKVSPSMHSLCVVMLKMAPRIFVRVLEDGILS